jgi:tetratricopeptide (TPR) repeat protein
VDGRGGGPPLHREGHRLALAAFVAAFAAALPAPQADAAEPRSAVRLCLSREAPAPESLAACREALSTVPAAKSVALRAYVARRLAAEARWDEVIVIHRVLADEQPADAEWPTRLGAALLLGAGRPAEAELALREALRRDAARAEAWGLLGGALASRQRYAEAVAALERAQSLDPGYLETRPALSELLAAARRGQGWP